MPPISIVDNEYITIEYQPDKQCICHTIHKPLADPLFQDALNAGYDALNRYGLCKWLSDDRNLGPLSPEILQWSATDWQPRMIAAGWKYWANVVPEEVKAAGTLMPLIEHLYGLGLQMMVFTDPEKAMQWLDGRGGS